MYALNVILVFFAASVGADSLIPSLSPGLMSSSISASFSPSVSMASSSSMSASVSSPAISSSSASMSPAISSSSASMSPAISSSSASMSPAIFSSSASMSPAISSSSASMSPAISSSASISASPSSAPQPTPTPTPKPTPKPVDYPLNVTFKGEDGKACLWFDADVTISYEIKHGKNASYTLKTKDLTGRSKSCSNFTEEGQISNFTLDFKEYTVALTFENNKDNWVFKTITVDINTSKASMYGSNSISGHHDFKIGTNGVSYEAKEGMAFQCDQSKEVSLTTGSNNTKITVNFMKVFVQPFSNNGTAADIVTCPSSESQPKSSSIVPIAVGCALAGLIVIVLIAYLIGRRKSDGRGYQQV